MAKVAGRRIAGTAMAVLAALAGMGFALLVSSHPTAEATPAATRGSLLGLSVPGVTLSVPSLTVSVPNLTVAVPSITVALPTATVSVPARSVPSPAPTASSPTISTPPPASPTTATPTPQSQGSTPASQSTGQSASHDPGRAAAVKPSPTLGRAGQASGTTKRAAPTTGHHTTTRARTRARSGVPGEPSRSTATGTLVSAKRVGAASHPASTRPTASSRNPLEAIGKHIPLPLPVPDWSKPIILALMLLAAWLAIRSRSSSMRARSLEGQRTSLLADVDVMQRALVPDVPSQLGALNASVAYRPADGPAAGGDFYDLFEPEPGKVAIILGDVAGHGRQALNRAALTRYTLRAYMQAGLEPRAALALTGRVLADPTAEGYATVAVGLYDEREGTLIYASAGHPAPILSGITIHRPIEICCSPPVGWDVPTGRRQTTISLPAGTLMCFFSDGLLEARCRERLLGRERLAAMIAGLDSPASADQLLERVRAMAYATPDDMAACILVPNHAGRTHLYTEELELDAEDIRRLDVRGFLAACGLPLGEIVAAVGQARRIASAGGTSLIRVERAHPNATATVTRATHPAEPDARAQRAQPPSQTLTSMR
jgi:Stage II sporulation protein E (SpoIIE)